MKIKKLNPFIVDGLCSRGMRVCLLVAAVFCGVANVGVYGGGEERLRTNIVWIIADDLSPDLNCYGDDSVATPSLDRLAESGIVFSNAYSSSPVCSASRSALVTGVYQTQIGCEHHRTHKPKRLPERYTTVMERLQKAGYFVTNRGKSDYNFKTDFRFDGKHWNKRKKGQPFFAQFQITDTHRPFKRAKHSQARLENIVLPERYPDHPVARADWANYQDSIVSMDRKVGVVLKELESAGVLDQTAVFFFGDHGRAHLWDKQWLYEGGIRVPLVVKLPQKKTTTDDDKKQLISLVDLPVATLELAGLERPESWLGHNFLDARDGKRQLVFAARDRSGDAVDRIRAVHDGKLKYIRNYHPELAWSTRSSYKEIRYPMLVLFRVLKKRGVLSEWQLQMMSDQRPAEELYDLENDPQETTNLVEDPAYAKRLAKKRAELDKWCDAYDTPFPNQEMSVAGFEKLKASKKKWLDNTMKRRGLSQYTDEEYLKWWANELGVRP